MFYDALETQTAVSKLKVSVGATSIIEPEEPDDLWTNEEPWNVEIDISSLEKMVDNLESEIGATATKAEEYHLNGYRRFGLSISKQLKGQLN